MSLGFAEARRPGLWLRLLLAAAVVATAVWTCSCGLFDTFHLEIKQYTFESKDLPSAFNGLRVGFVTDIHMGPFYSEADVGHLVDRVNALHTDLIVLGGDYVYSGTKYEASCFAQLARLRAPLGCYAVLGNHDCGRPDSANPGTGLAVKAAAQAGIPLLLNQGVWLKKDGQRIRLGGVEDLETGRPQVAPIIKGTKPTDFVLLVSHNPDYSEELPRGAVDLVLSGHTHGGQVTLFGVWALDTHSKYGLRYLTGMVKNGVTTVIVSNGIGTATPLPIRIYAPAQIVVVTFRSVPSASVRP